ncbi:hypothetical protein K470DRAFT_290553 [Piedraia hortae CBS 480.64]|uniref:Uncharacterized protein n=1 Tax=Piedraia hortae CBS 480.64 TaxID=1314780 RepID=A0A6A7C6X7_9PEZI|nr:hypothetical protein K470DRAFT_290553 [Piedraia hortae CBS 480.64]
MAVQFSQQQRQRVQSSVSHPQPAASSHPQPAASPTIPSPTKEWILFRPQSPVESTDSLSLVDSLDDSLDGHLPAFDQTQTSDTVLLPRHDGLGTFSSAAVQEQIWHFEPHNPRKRHVHDLSHFSSPNNPTARIEKWRRDHALEPRSEDAVSLSPSTWWQRIITYIGLDEALLSLIFTDRPSPLEKPPSRVAFYSTTYAHKSWRHIDRIISRELGVLVHQLLEESPSCSAKVHPAEEIQFKPTLNPVEDDDDDGEIERTLYWEREVDVAMLLAYLSHRFSPFRSRKPTTTPDSRRAARINHPLIKHTSN